VKLTARTEVLNGRKFVAAVLGAQVEDFVWFGTLAQLTQISQSKPPMLDWGNCQIWLVFTDASQEEIRHLPGLPVAVLSPTDFKYVLATLQQMKVPEKAQASRLGQSSGGDNKPPPPPPPPTPPSSNGGPPSSFAPTEESNSQSVSSSRKGCSWGGEVCISNEGASFSVTCNGVGLQIATQGQISVVVEGHAGTLNINMGGKDSE
jgi:hypothetical protein